MISIRYFVWICGFVVLCISGTARAMDYQFDRLNRLVAITYDNGQQLTYFYDAAGNRATFMGTTYSVSVKAPTAVPTPGFALPKGQISSYPNPFKFGKDASVNFVFEPGLEDVTLDVYDTSFRKIFSISASNIDAAHGKATWDGIGRDGTKVPTHLYFITLHSKSYSTSGKFTVLR